MLLSNDHPMLYDVKKGMIRKIQEEISKGAFITCDIPDFLKDSFGLESLELKAEEALGGQVEANQLDRAVMEHVKTRKIWFFGDETNSEETKQKAAHHLTKQYQVFDPSNPLVPVNTPYLIVREGDLAAHTADLDVYFVASPSLTMVLDYGLATAINWTQTLPTSVLHISFVAPQVTTIGNNFLARSALKAVDFSGLSGVTAIGGNFILKCKALKSVNFSGLTGVTVIGYNFLLGCKALESINFAGLTALTTIGAYCLAECHALKVVNTSGLSSLNKIENKFLYWCKNLFSVDLSCLVELTELGDDFLMSCPALEFVNLKSLSRITNIGDNFLRNCTKLGYVNLSECNGVTTIGHCFLYNGQNAPPLIAGMPTTPAWEVIQKAVRRSYQSSTSNNNRAPRPVPLVSGATLQQGHDGWLKRVGQAVYSKKKWITNIFRGKEPGKAE